jgi:16S rRNA (uracil1498-N3)-methyltransferase
MPATKSLNRLYFPGKLQPGTRCLLPAAQAHHAARVLRLGVADGVVLFNGDGAEYPAAIVRAAKSGVEVEVHARQSVDREAPVAVTLAQAVSSGERMDYTLQKAVELGVAAIQPLETRRGIVRLSPERAARRLLHWRSVVIAACEQCGRNRVPEVAPLVTMDAWLHGVASVAPTAMRLLLSPRGEARLTELGPPRTGIVLLAGAEAGLAPEEERAALAAGMRAVYLGPRVLRTETAAVAALAAIQALWGDF